LFKKKVDGTKTGRGGDQTFFNTGRRGVWVLARQGHGGGGDDTRGGKKTEVAGMGIGM